MVLKVEPSTARSPSAGRTSTLTARLPREICSAAPMSWRIGATRRLANHMPIQIAVARRRQREGEIHEAVSDLETGAPPLERLILGKFGARRC